MPQYTSKTGHQSNRKISHKTLYQFLKILLKTINFGKKWAALKTPVSHEEKRGKFQSPTKIVALRDVIIHFSSRYHKKTFLFSEISLELRIFGLDKELAMIIFSAEIIYSGWVFVLIISIFRILKQNLFKIAFQGAMGNVWGALMTIPEVSRR